MAIKRYSDFDSNSIKSDVHVEVEVETNNINKDVINEEVLLKPKNDIIRDNNISIEILEENIIKFNEGDLNDIMETLKTKYSDTNYFLRKKDNQLHIVKYNESLTLNINEFVNNLLKYYSSKTDLKKIVEGIKVKGNSNFTIIENMNFKYSDKFINDLTKLLSNKK